jgi:hypothetical protein
MVLLLVIDADWITASAASKSELKNGRWARNVSTEITRRRYFRARDIKILKAPANSSQTTTANPYTTNCHMEGKIHGEGVTQEHSSTLPARMLKWPFDRVH